MDYSGEEFANFMEMRGGAELDYWSMEEIEELVKEFKISHKKISEMSP
jgi:hypothetical protein